MPKKTTKKKATKRKTTTTTKKAKAMDMLLVGSKVKTALKGTGKSTYNVSSDTLEALNNYVYWLVDQAQKRCEANGRKTIRPYDILT